MTTITYENFELEYELQNEDHEGPHAEGYSVWLVAIHDFENEAKYDDPTQWDSMMYESHDVPSWQELQEFVRDAYANGLI